MVITELIARLEELKENHGDLPVYLDQEKDKEYSFHEVSKAHKIHLYKDWLDSKDGKPEDKGYVIALKR